MKNIPFSSTFASEQALPNSSGPTGKAAFMRGKAHEHLRQLQRDPLYHRLVIPLSRNLRLSEADIIHGYHYYNNEINQYDNTIYDSMQARFALLLNYLAEGGWFARRLQTYSSMACRFPTISDIGFGFPLLLLNRLRRPQAPLPCMLQLLDKFASAFEFADCFIWLLRKEFPDGGFSRLEISYDYLDLDAPQETLTVPLTGELVVALDCVEHALDPLTATKRVATNAFGQTILVGLPIGPIIPQHSIEYSSVQDAVNFLASAGLSAVSAELVRPSWCIDLIGNPDFDGSVFVKTMAT